MLSIELLRQGEFNEGIVPQRGSELAVGYDLFMPESGSVLAIQKTPTVANLGVKIQIPTGYAGFIIPRSSAGIKYGLYLANSTGLIDPDYTGEWILNILRRPIKFESGEIDLFSWERGDRLFQFVILPCLTEEFQVVDSLDKTARGDGGFGSTGLNDIIK